MSARELYGVSVRLLGLAFVVCALFDAFHLVAKIFDIDPPSPHGLAYLSLATAFYACFGAAFLAFAERVATLAYGRKT